MHILFILWLLYTVNVSSNMGSIGLKQINKRSFFLNFFFYILSTNAWLPPDKKQQYIGIFHIFYIINESEHEILKQINWIRF